MRHTSATVLVTGATGFLGSHLTRALLVRGVRVRAMGRQPAALAALEALGAQPICGDLRDREGVLAACCGVSAVYHVGAFSAPWGSRAEFEAVNVGGTAAVLEGCRRAGVDRLLYVSSPSVVFGGSDQENVPDDLPYPRRFASVYSETKKRGEDLVNASRAEVPSVILRPKAIFGPGDTTLLPRLLTAARQRRLPQIGDGTNRVDLTYVDNVVHALLLAAEAPAAVGNTYTITNGEAIPPLWSVIRKILSSLGVPTDLRRLPLGVALAVASAMESVAHVTGREPILTRYTVQILAHTQTYDISRARRDLGYAPVVPFAEAMERTIAHYGGAGILQ